MIKILRYLENKKNNHYFYVMGWKDGNMQNAPLHKQKFDIYEEAIQFFKTVSKKCEYVVIFENIGGKRKWIADTEDTSNL